MSQPCAHGLASAHPPHRGRWLFSAPVDLTVFLGSALVALALLPVGAALGVLHGDTPEWAWVAAILLIDVGHVWSTGFRVYLDTDELRRRAWLYALVPLCGWLCGVALYSESAALFWRVLAYMAAFHFVRQQYGWVALYRARAGEHDALGRWLDTATIYAATVYPLLYWHAHLPRAFAWFVPGDFVAVPALAATAAAPLYWTLMAAYAARSAWRWLARSQGNPGKDIVVATTAVCWYVGIVALDSDFAFAITNVIIHGVPYMALVYWYSVRRCAQGRGGPALRSVFARRWLAPWLFLAALALLAYAEELLWDRWVWHERTWLFGSAWSLEHLHMFLVPLLAVPQLTHYVLDGFIWRRRHNPELIRMGQLAGASRPAAPR